MVTTNLIPDASNIHLPLDNNRGPGHRWLAPNMTGNTIVQGKTTACGTCHGLDLHGVADVPPIAGRSPSYLARQLFDIQRKTRNGVSAQLMHLVGTNENCIACTDLAPLLAQQHMPLAMHDHHAVLVRMLARRQRQS